MAREFSCSDEDPGRDLGELRLAGLNEDLRTLFELTKLDSLFTIADTPEQAIAAF